MNSSPLSPPTVELRQRMESAFATCVAEGLPVLALALQAFDRRPRQDPEATAEFPFRKSLLALLESRSPGPLIAYPVGEQVLAFLPGLDEAGQKELCDGLLADARDARLVLGIGVAHRGQRELLMDTLLLVAREGVKVAECRGGDCAVHTMLYEALARTAERVRAEEAEGGAPLPLWTDCEPELALLPGPEERLVPERDEEPRPVLAVLEPEPPTTQPATMVAAVTEELRPVVLRHSAPSDELRIEDRVAAMAQDIAERAIEEARREFQAGGLGRATPAVTSPEAQEEIERLRRRIDKLMGTLEETERRLAEARAHQPGDSGVPSRFKSVQGLNGEEGDYERRVELMSAIFEANLELARLSGGRQSDVA